VGLPRAPRGETVERLFGDRWIDVLRFNRIDRLHVVAGTSLKVPRRLADVRSFTPMPAIYPEASREPKFVLVDLSEQFLGAYEYGRLAFSSPLSVGAKDHPTPTGDFRISAAHRAHWSSLYDQAHEPIRLVPEPCGSCFGSTGHRDGDLAGGAPAADIVDRSVHRRPGGESVVHEDDIWARQILGQRARVVERTAASHLGLDPPFGRLNVLRAEVEAGDRLAIECGLAILVHCAERQLGHTGSGHLPRMNERERPPEAFDNRQRDRDTAARDRGDDTWSSQQSEQPAGKALTRVRAVVQHLSRRGRRAAAITGVLGIAHHQKNLVIRSVQEARRIQVSKISDDMS
jgi:hypothetical protein